MKQAVVDHKRGDRSMTRHRVNKQYTAEVVLLYKGWT